MPPLPKKKRPKARRDRRRSHMALQALNLTACPSCGSLMMPHRVCPTCGKYDGRQVIEIEEAAPPAAAS